MVTEYDAQELQKIVKRYNGTAKKNNGRLCFDIPEENRNAFQVEYEAFIKRVKVKSDIYEALGIVSNI